MTHTPVTVYHIGPTCQQCNMTKKQFDKLGIIYDEVDLREHPEFTQRFKDLGHLAAPIVTAGEQIWSGFKFERIKKLAALLDLDRVKE